MIKPRTPREKRLVAETRRTQRRKTIEAMRANARLRCAVLKTSLDDDYGTGWNHALQQIALAFGEKLP